MITISWHFLILGAFILFALFRIGREDTGGDYSFNMVPLFCIIAIIIAVVVYGGIFWA